MHAFWPLFHASRSPNEIPFWLLLLIRSVVQLKAQTVNSLRVFSIVKIFSIFFFDFVALFLFCVRLAFVFFSARVFFPVFPIHHLLWR